MYFDPESLSSSQVENMSSDSTAKVADAANRCDVVNQHDTEKEKQTNLSRFLSDLTPEQQFRRTADYVKDPKAYLQSVLGPETFSEREHLLSIPDKFDQDIYGNGEHKAHFQRHIANLFGKEHGLFFITGVQAQLAAMRIHCDRAGNRRVTWHVTSHLEEAENKSYEALYGLQRRFLGSRRDENPSVDEIKEVLALPEEQRPAVMLLEIPNRVLGCATYTFSELEKISSACKTAGVKLHCDGARIWEIEPYYRRTAGKSFADVAKLFDSIYVSFYKGLRGAAGAMLLCNDETLIAEAKTWQRRAGGNAFTLFYEVIDCERGYNENIGSFEAKWKKMEDIVDGIKQATVKFSTTQGNPVVAFMPDKANCCQIRTAFQGCTADELLAARDKVMEKRNVTIFDRLWPKKALDDQTEEELQKWVKTGNPYSEADAAKKLEDEDRKHAIEWMIVKQVLELDTKVFVDAYVALCEELGAGSK
jgi:threonine aldolase